MGKTLRIAAVVLVLGFLVAVTVENLARHYGLGPYGNATGETDAGDPAGGTAAPSPSEPPEPVPTDSPSADRPLASGPEPPAHAQPMRVRFVWDGDTVELQAEESGDIVTTEARIPVRLIGVDTPEIESQRRENPSECYGDEAHEFLRELLPVDTLVVVDRDRSTRDDFDRRLLYIWRESDGLFVNHELVAQGYGEALRIWPNVAYWDALSTAQRTAERAGWGLWGAC